MIKVKEDLTELLGHKDVNKTLWDIEGRMREEEKYNGWVNYETWLLDLILTNDQELELKTKAAIRNFGDKTVYEKADLLKHYIEENYFVEQYGIIRVDCESWTYRDFQEIHFEEIIRAFEES